MRALIYRYQPSIPRPFISFCTKSDWSIEKKKPRTMFCIGMQFTKKASTFGLFIIIKTIIIFLSLIIYKMGFVKM